jgi:four helix bundle protein
LMGQVRRAAVSIPSNIAEGQTRASTREYLNYISMAQSSLAELETQLEIALRLSYIGASDLQSLLQTAGLLGRKLYALRNALERK